MPDWAVSGIFNANASGFINAFSKVKSAFYQTVPGVKALSGAFHSIADQVAIGNLVSRGIQGVGEMLRSIPEFAENAEKIGRASSLIGTTSDNLQRLQYAAKMTDTPVESVQMAFRKLNLAVGQGERGLGPLIKQMSRLNPALALQLRSTRDSQTAFNLVAQAIRGTTNVQMRAAIATAAFGRQGQELIPMFINQDKSLQTLMKDAGVYGAILDDKAIAASERFADANKRMSAGLQQVKNVILTNLVTALAPYVEKITVWIAANKELIATRITSFIEGMANALRSAWPFLKILIGGAGWLVKNWPLLGLVYIAWIASQVALDAVLEANPIAGVILVIEALGLAVMTVIKYWQQIITTIRSAWNWFDKLYNKSLLLRNAIFFLAMPIWLVVEAVRTLVDLLSGRGLKSFENFIPPWLKGATDKLGLTSQNPNQGYWNNAQAPNKGQGTFSFINQIQVDNTRAPGVTSAVRAAPALTGVQGLQYSMGTP